MVAYFLQVNVCWLLFYGAYYALLSKETFFRLNRLWLIVSLLCGLALPFVADYFAVKVVPTELFVMTLEPFVVTATTFQHDLVSDTEGVALRCLAMGYMLGVAVLTARFLAGLFLIFKLFLQSKREKKDGFLLVFTEGGIPPFSFFRFIFINPNEFDSVDFQQIMQHEQAHVRQRHSFDVVFMEVLNIVFWCSPLVYFYKESLRNVHEYLADEAVLRTNTTPQYGRLLLRQQQSGVALSLTSNISNHFFSQLKKRILMMTRNKSKRTALIKYALAAPIFLILTAALASPKLPILAKTEVLSDKVVKAIDKLEKEESENKIVGDNSLLANIMDLVTPSSPSLAAAKNNIDTMPKIKEGETIVYVGNYKTGGIIKVSELQKIDKVNAFMMVNGKLEEGIVQSYVVVRVSRGEDPQQANVIGSHISEPLKGLIEKARGGDQFQFFQIKGRWTGEAEVRNFGSMSFLVKDDVSSSVNNIDPNDIKSVNVNKDEVNGNSVTIEMKDGTIRVLKGEELKQWEKYNEGDRVRIFSNKQPIYTIVDENPEFPQGQAALFKWLGSNIQYPKEARDNKIEGTVYVGFVVNQDGAISDVVVKRGIGGGCNQEAVRVISAMPNWKPGKLKGQFVRVAYTLPIKFKIDQNNTNIEPKTQQQSNVEAEKNTNDQIYTIVDQNPEFPQGQAALFKWLGENIKYPVTAREAGGAGIVYVGFVVETDGSITNINIKRDVPVVVYDTVTVVEVNGIKGNKIVQKMDYSLGREAVRVISAMPKWKPGKSKGVPVRVAYTLPIKFKLE